MIRQLALVLIAAAPLAACDDGKPGTSITINSSDGNMVAGMDGNSGDMAIDVPVSRARSSCPGSG